ncbi:MAG TPA: cobalt ECF transporter T component CbiQ [Desulfonatronum sp.]|nr:cobalt ECF transporter T component CbiQ [Desulfonatronum sp.]
MFMQITELSNGYSRLLSRVDPRAKLLAAGLCMVCVSAIRGFDAALAALLFALVLTFAAGVRLQNAVLRLAPANVFFLVLGFVLGLSYPGKTPEGIPWISLDGLELALRIAVKGNTLLLVFMAMVCTSSVPALSHALQALGLPRKLTLLLAFTHGQVFLVRDEFHRLHRAALARGFSPRCTMHTYRTYAVLLGQTVLRSLSRAERIHGAMLLRGFTGRFHTLASPALGWREILLVAALGMVPVLICLHDRWPL